jgi:hypothetical protein
MKRFWVFGLILAFAAQAALLASPVQRRHRPPRRVVVVHRGFPLKRALRPVVVRPLARPFRILPRTYLPLVVWAGVAAAAGPRADILVWEDGATLTEDEAWTEIGLNCENRGTRLWLEVVNGRVRFDWAEVVFDNGDARVVEMSEYVRGPGYYPLLDFTDGREVDHVRLIAQSETPQARVVLKMEK